ncbi:Rz1-like lysis system protein LysC [Azotobacter bryophylli]|uniref:Rz1-like lysis system protein LysC n=1 Tax=Azotobacter bryophylli TaxID=1986537 RepID=A0ABV7B1D1_9GAMM
MAGCTSGPRPPIPPPTTARINCPLTPCRLPARPALHTNDDWRAAVDALEGELLSCAGQVLECIERQRLQALPVSQEAPVPMAQ